MRRSSAGFAFSTRTSAWTPVTRMVSPSADTPTPSIPGVPAAKTVSLAPSKIPRSASTRTTPVPGEVADVDEIGAAAGADLGELDAGHVRARDADVAADARAGADGLHRELLGLGGADDLQRVAAGLALEDVRAVVAALDRGVVARAHEQRVVAGTREHEVVVVAARDRLRAAAADDDVRARAGLDGGRLGVREGAVGLVEADLVRSRAGADRDLSERRAVERVVDGAVGADVDLQRPGSAGREPQRETIGGRVAGDGQRVGGHGGHDRGFGGPGQDRDGGEDEAQGEK